MEIPTRSRPEFLRADGPIAMAHQGFAPTRSIPQNSMAAFAEAVRLGYRYLETDVRATRDGVAVILHDRKIDSLPRPIDKLDWKDIPESALGNGESIATLEAVLHNWPTVRLNIDVKARSAIRPTADVIERLNAHDRVLIASFSDLRRRRTLRRLTKAVATSAGSRVIVALLAAATIGCQRCASRALRDVDCVQLPARRLGLPFITPRLVRAIHAAGRQVHAWTIDSPTEMNRLLDSGVDGIISDRADKLRELLIARGDWAC